MKDSHLPCPCGRSSDAFAVNENGWGTCFSANCEEGGPKHKFKPGSFEDPNADDRLVGSRSVPDSTTAKDVSPITSVFRPWKDRGFTKETVQRYKVDVGGPEAKYLAKYPLFNTDKEHVANKVRYPDKSFPHEGTVKNTPLMLFGQQAFEAGEAKAITVTEGQDDAMAVFEMTGRRYPAVSVHSASTAERDIRENFDYLNSFDTVVLCFDNDEAGRKAVKTCANIGFPLGKVKVLSLRKYKDANDYLVNQETEAFTREWWNAPVHKPDGLFLGSDIWENIITRKESFTTQYPWKGLNDMTFGLRLSEFVLITAEQKIGKTSVVKAIEHKLLTDPEIKEKGYGLGFLHFEEPIGDTALGLLSIHNGVPYHLPTSERPEKEIRQAYDELLNNNRVVIWDHFGSNSVDAVLDKIRHMVALGCKYIVLDHLSIVVSDQSGDERKQLDEIATKIKTLTMQLDIAVVAVIHVNRQGQVRGSAGPEQLANIVLHLYRDKLDENKWRRNVTKVIVTDNRFCGYTGPACYLFYNENSARLSELDPVEVSIYESGGNLDNDTF